MNNTKFGYLASITSDVQVQLNAKVKSVAAAANMGLAASGTATEVQLGLTTSGCSDGHVMTYNGGSWSCAAPSGGGGITKTAYSTPYNNKNDGVFEVAATCGSGTILSGYCWTSDPDLCPATGCYGATSGGTKTSDISNMKKWVCQFLEYNAPTGGHDVEAVAICN